jgi:flagellar hook-associated protein 1
MTIPSFTALETALSGLQAAQAAIDTTGQNIANANTPGYSRQTVNLTERAPLVIPALSSVNGNGGQLGAGVDVSSISRIRDQFLDTQYRAQSTTSAAATQKATDLTSAQSTLNEPSSDGISTQLQGFWSAWSNVANTPTGTGAPAALASLVGAATTLAQTFNTVDNQLSTVQANAQSQLTELTGSTGQVQTDVNQIAALNGEIAQSTAVGQTPNDLLDQRDQALDDLSGFGSLSVTAGANGVVNVSFNTAAPNTTPATPTAPPFTLVSGTTASDVSTMTGAQLSQVSGQLGALSSDASPTGPIGSLMGPATSPDSLDGVASQLINAVNGALPAGSPPFFSPTATGTSSAATIAVAPAVVANPSTIPLTSPGSTTSADVAAAIAALQGGTADQSYAAFVAQAGSSVRSAQSAGTTASSLLTSINSQRQSVSGVSLDEEMTNLINFQQGYQASAKVMNTIDTMLNTLINNTGL